MAIEKYGQSLLADVRSRRDDRDRKAERSEKKQAIAGLLVGGGVAIGNAYLKGKANKFLESEAFMKENMEFKKGYNISNEFIETEKLARNDKLGYDNYWTKVAGKETVDTAMAEKFGEAKKYSASEWKDLRSNLRSEVGAAAKIQHEKGLGDAQSFIASTGSKGAEFYADFAKKSRPTNVKDLIMQKTQSLFGSKDLNVEARALKRKKYLTSAEGIVSFDKAYDATGNTRIAEFFADTTIQLGAAAPVLEDEYVDIGGTDSMTGLPTGDVLMTKAKYWDGSVRYVSKDGEAFTPKTLKLTQDLAVFVGRHSGTDAASKATQGIGATIITDYTDEKDAEFFKEQVEQGAKGLYGTQRIEAMASSKRALQANIAGLSFIFKQQYNMSSAAASRLAIVMHREKLETRQKHKDNGIVGTSPYNHGNVFGMALAMAKQQGSGARNRDFQNDNIDKLLNSKEAKKAMFEDYIELTPKGKEEYDKLAEESGNPEVKKSFKRIQGLTAIALKPENSKIRDLEELERLYEESLLAPTATTTTTTMTPISSVVEKKKEVVPVSLAETKAWYRANGKEMTINLEEATEAYGPEIRKYADKQASQKSNFQLLSGTRQEAYDQRKLDMRLYTAMNSDEKRYFNKTKKYPKRIQDMLASGELK
jgi:hypothetical protein